jgi:hypothetical protein
VFPLGSRGKNSHFSLHSVRPPVERTGVAAWPSSAGMAIPGFPVVEGPDGVRGRRGVAVETLDAAPLLPTPIPLISFSPSRLSCYSLRRRRFFPSIPAKEERDRCRRSVVGAALHSSLLSLDRRQKGSGRSGMRWSLANPLRHDLQGRRIVLPSANLRYCRQRAKRSNRSRRHPCPRLHRDGTC